MTTVISVENLSKSYQLGQIGTGTFAHDLNVWWARMRGRPNPMLRIGETDHGHRDGEEIWALKDVSFTVQQGEVLGIIGRNGAGKSTLLKILSRVTAPTSGKIKVKGRVASLLEVGTGFHPELTGRENVYLNGAILGMSRREIDRKFDEIVDFAEVEKFIDTPVKRYSSGMYVRLAFAVAAHLEPEILVVDEVLAVGDAEFQKKCLGKMGDVAHEGRTVLFVSHNMGAVSTLCQQSILLNKGDLQLIDETEKVIDEYMVRNTKENYSGQVEIFRQSSKKKVMGHFVRIHFRNKDGQMTQVFGSGEKFTVDLHAHLNNSIPSMSVGIEIFSSKGMQVFNLRSDSQGISLGPYAGGSDIVFSVEIPGLPLYPGLYIFRPWFAELGGKRIDDLIDGIAVYLELRGRYQSEKFIQQERGLLMLDCVWKSKKCGNEKQ
jgi:lipopolysaccharide transport system ATP-binding protein